MLKFLSRSPGQTKRLAKKILTSALKARYQPVILALCGELGSGKTTFIQGLARALGIREKIHSPTFVLIKWYKIPKRFYRFHRFHRFHHFVHIDAYRIESSREARRLGLKNVFQDHKAIIVIEWAEQIRKFIPRGAVWVRFQHGRQSRERIVEISKS